MSREELAYYLNHWGFVVNEEEFDYIFNVFDIDQDGEINFTDFQKVIGPELNPSEGLYFRQDKQHIIKAKKCFEYQCWSPAMGNGKYCPVHAKMYNFQVEKLYLTLFFQSGNTKWESFKNLVMQNAAAEDSH